MGKPPQPQAKLFYYHLRIDDRIPQDHLLRKIQTMVDFDFTYGLVQEHYGIKGNVSVPPRPDTPVSTEAAEREYLWDRTVRLRSDERHLSLSGGPDAHASQAQETASGV